MFVVKNYIYFKCITLNIKQKQKTKKQEKNKKKLFNDVSYV